MKLPAVIFSFEACVLIYDGSSLATYVGAAIFGLAAIDCWQFVLRHYLLRRAAP